MRVRRSEVSCRDWIQPESRVSGANAISVSLSGSGSCPIGVRVNRSFAGKVFCRESRGFHEVAGATEGPGENFRGPVRRSYNGAIVFRQLPAAILRSLLPSSNCTSFSASAKVDVETGGPASGDVPKAGGAPGVAVAASGPPLRHPGNAANRQAETRVKN